MVFSSLTFLCIFLVSVIILDRILPKTQLKNAILLLASLVFYAYGEPVFVLLMLASSALNYIWALLIDRFSARKVFLTLSVITNLGALVFYKYSVFITTSVNDAFKTTIPVPEVTLPLGISFFTFQAMSYVIDVYRKDCSVQKNYFKLLLYISFFPQLVAGPIVKYKDIADEIDNRSYTSEDTLDGIKRFAIGLSKKVLIANNVAYIADSVFDAAPETIGMSAAWLAAVAYMLQIFFDFSGYSDMAIGLGKLFGFHFKENFNYPYISSSVKEFWRRWHISLSTWFKEYLYIPLGGNRKGKIRTVINKYIVFAATGIWHGANWTFLLWGLYHGTFQMIEEYMPKPQKEHKILKVLSHLYLILVVLIGFVLFRCDSLSQFGMMMSKMFIPSEALTSTRLLTMSIIRPLDITALIVGILFSTPIIKRLENNKYVKSSIYVLAIFGIVLSLLCLSSGTYNPFIYFRF